MAGATDILVRVVSVYSNKCLDVTGGSLSAGALVQQWGCNGNRQQDFVLRPIPS